jgi:undecaprenyl-diphosphatase
MELSIFNFFHGWAGFSILTDWFFIFCARFLGYFLIALALYVIFRAENFKTRFYNFATVSLSLLLAYGLLRPILRFIYARPRPFAALGLEPLFQYANDGSFPSGHATFYMCLAVAIFFVNRKFGWWAILTALFIGVSRIVSGVHWPLDILAGFFIGWGSVILIRNRLNK